MALPNAQSGFSKSTKGRFGTDPRGPSEPGAGEAGGGCGSLAALSRRLPASGLLCGGHRPWGSSRLGASVCWRWRSKTLVMVPSWGHLRC